MIPKIALKIAFANNPYDTSPTYVDVNTDIAGGRLLSWSFERGRRTVLDAIDPARLTVTLDNRDRWLDPSNDDSPYWPNVLPGKRVVLELGENWDGNPRAETTTADRAGFVTAGSVSVSQFTNDLLATGYEITGTPSSGTDIVLYWNDASTGTPVTAGDKVYLSAYVRKVSGTLGSLTLRARGSNSSNVVINQDVVATRVSPVDGVWYKLEGVWTVPAGVTKMSVQVNGVGTTGQAGTYRATAHQLVKSDQPQPYVDSPIGLYSGFIEGWPQDWEGMRNTVNLTALDIFDTFNVDMIPATVYPIAKSGTRIAAGLTELGVPAGWQSLNTGIDDMQAKTAGDEDSWLEHFKQVAITEQGYLFQDRLGNVKFYQRHALSQAPFTTVQGTFSNAPQTGEWQLQDVDDPDFSVREVRNDVRITRQGGAVSRVTDATSVSKYRRRTYQQTTLHNDVNVPADLAGWILQLFKDPKLRPDGVTIAPLQDVGMLDATLRRDLADRIRMKVQPPGGGDVIDAEYAIQSIAVAQGEDRTLTVKWGLAPPTGAAQIWLLGTQTLGIDTYLGY